MAATRKRTSLYGLRTALSGTLLPARPVGSAFPDLIRRLVAEGHEAAIHAWDHRAWQDGLPRFRLARIRAHFRRAHGALAAILGHAPAGIGAPSWTTTPESLRLQDELQLAYASDLRGGAPCRLSTRFGVMRLPQLPATGSCLEELLAQGCREPQELAGRLFAELRRLRHRHCAAADHPRRGRGRPVPGRARGPAAAPGRSWASWSPCRRLSRGWPARAALPIKRWCLQRLPGRAFPASAARAPQALVT